MKNIFKTLLTTFLIVLISSAVIVFISCKPGTPAATAGTGDLADFVLESIPGSTLHSARKTDANGNLQIEGFVDGQTRTGQWIEYSPAGDIQLIQHYVNGMLEGTALKMGFRNQVDLKATYKQNQLDGPWTSYKFGKVIEQRFYKASKLEGTVSTYDERTFKLKQEVQYKNGLQDGYYKYYDDEGKLSLEYLYKNGEKISGGIVEEN